VRTRVALATGLGLLALGLGITLSGSPVELVRSNSTPAKSLMAATSSGGAEACQSGEALPAGTSAIRLTLLSTGGPQVYVKVLSGARLLTSGSVGSGWGGGSVTVPVRAVDRTTAGARTCLRLGPTKEKVGFIGTRTSPALAAKGGEGEALPGRLRIEYLRRSHSSWWSLVPTIARRMGLGRAPSGAWVTLLAAILVGTAMLAACWLTIRELG
jgi:hypothetical protein